MVPSFKCPQPTRMPPWTPHSQPGNLNKNNTRTTYIALTCIHLYTHRSKHTQWINWGAQWWLQSTPILETGDMTRGKPCCWLCSRRTRIPVPQRPRVLPWSFCPPNFLPFFLLQIQSQLPFLPLPSDPRDAVVQWLPPESTEFRRAWAPRDPQEAQSSPVSGEWAPHRQCPPPRRIRTAAAVVQTCRSRPAAWTLGRKSPGRRAEAQTGECGGIWPWFRIPAFTAHRWSFTLSSQSCRALSSLAIADQSGSWKKPDRLF